MDLTIWEFIESLIVTILYLALFVIGIYAARTGMAPMPSTPKARRIIINELKKLKPQKGPIYELGAGYGTLAIAMAKTFPDTKIIAIELSPPVYFILWIRKLWNRCNNLTLMRKNIYKIDYGDAEIIVCYLFTRAMFRLQYNHFDKLKKGTKIITNTFSIPEMKIEQLIEVGDWLKSEILIYTK
jgi:16S rRNA A1518/A1519 N6-dimethyltransferase RsmA/KsgA/DIM1 with predicted DNA glycosylase/AP lyase activity